MTMDKRNNKETLLKEIERLEAWAERIYEAGCWGIEHVGIANYHDREQEAMSKLQKAYYEED